MPSPEFSPERLRKRKVSPAVTKALGFVGAVAAVLGVGQGINVLSQKSVEGTHFSSSEAAMAKLRQNAAAHKDDLDIYQSAQDRMERDLRGANPLIIRDLAQQAAAIPDINRTLKDGQQVTVFEMPDDDGGARKIITLKDPKNNRQQEITLTSDEKGTFEEFEYENHHTVSTPEQPSDLIGGPQFDYKFPGNDFMATNTTQYADGSPLVKDFVGSAIIVNNTRFSPYVAAGPATDTVVENFEGAQQLLNTVAGLPQK